MNIFFVNISYFQQFASIFLIFWHFLVIKKLMTLAYNKWCQHAFAFNMHQIDCLTIVHSYIDIRLAFLEMLRRRSGENYPKMPSLIRVSSYKINSLSEREQTKGKTVRMRTSCFLLNKWYQDKIDTYSR